MSIDIFGRIEEALRTCGVSFHSGEFQLLEWRKSTSRDGPKVKFLLPDDDDIAPFARATVRKGNQAGQRYRYILMEIGDDELPLEASPAAPAETEEPEAHTEPVKPYGKIASELYRSGFFYVPDVLAAIGSDREFLEWVRRQPCAMTGSFDYHKDEATGETRMQCEAAHVSRIEYGRGVTHKPPYAAIPLVHLWHAAQHAHGERVFDTTDKARPNPNGDPSKGRAWMERKRNEYVMRWAGSTLAHTLGYESMGMVPPQELLAWAKEHGVAKYLPQAYVKAANAVQSGTE